MLVYVSVFEMLPLSCALMMNVKPPIAVGVPETIPVFGSRLRPVGSAPEVIEKLTMPMASAVVRAKVYGCDTIPPHTVGDVMRTTGVMLIVNVKAPIAVGVPEMIPVFGS